MIRFSCPRCKKTFHVDAKFAGRKTKCPGCNGQIEIPSESHPSQGSGDGGATADNQQENIFGRRLGLFIGLATLSAIGIALWFTFGRDTWEVDNLQRILNEISQAAKSEVSNPADAYKAYKAVVDESNEHNLTIPMLVEGIQEASKRCEALLPAVESQLRLEKAEKKRREQEEAARIAWEQAKQQEQDRLELTAKLAEERALEQRKAEEARLTDAASLYQSIPKSARVALNAIKKIEARTEIGITYRDYSEVVGNTWADVKLFLESRGAKKLSELSTALSEAMIAYKVALDIWGNKIEYDSLFGDSSEVDAHQQKCWLVAGLWIDVAEALVDGEDQVESLKAYSDLKTQSPNLENEWISLQNKILGR